MTLIGIMVITIIISIMGFNNPTFFQKYMFHIGAITKGKENIRLISCGFLHGNYMHLAFNMLTIYFFGPLIVKYLGEISFLIIYIGSLLSGSIFSLYIYKNNFNYSAIGTSGAISGILSAAIAIDPNIRIGFMFIPIPGYIFGVLYFGYSVYMILNPKQWDNLGHIAHLGGALFGIVCATIFETNLVFRNFIYILIMSLPMLYLGYQIIIKKKTL